MNPNDPDPILDRLRDLPAPPLDAAAVLRVQRLARAALHAEGQPEARLSRMWTGSLLPALLAAAGLVYTWQSISQMQSIYIEDRSVASR
jgi:hypothetical protein